MTGALSVLDRTGDTEITWDPEVEAEVDAARGTFRALREKGYMAYRVEGDDRTQIHRFEPDAARIVMQRPLVGG